MTSAVAKAKQADHFHQTRLGFLVFGTIELALFYVFASLSIDRGSFWLYLLTFIFLVGALHNIVKLCTKLFTRHG
jgi:hypothetical protein